MTGSVIPLGYVWLGAFSGGWKKKEWRIGKKMSGRVFG